MRWVHIELICESSVAGAVRCCRASPSPARSMMTGRTVHAMHRLDHAFMSGAVDWSVHESLLRCCALRPGLAPELESPLAARCSAIDCCWPTVDCCQMPQERVRCWGLGLLQDAETWNMHQNLAWYLPGHRRAVRCKTLREVRRTNYPLRCVVKDRGGIRLRPVRLRRCATRICSSSNCIGLLCGARVLQLLCTHPIVLDADGRCSA